MLLIFSSSFAFAQLYKTEDIKNFQQYNPDRNKYAFVKNYLTSLQYLKKNSERAERVRRFSEDEFEQGEDLQSLLKDLLNDNMNLRIARNFVKRYNAEPNGFILKVTNLFIQVCDEQIAFNKEEQGYIEALYDEQLEVGMDGVDRRAFFQDIKGLASRRKESLRQLLEASLFVKKLLISNKMDEYGEFVTLGITGGQRENLLLKLDDFYEEDFQGELREGQTFLQGSVAVIREILEDYSWDTLEG